MKALCASGVHLRGDCPYPARCAKWAKDQERGTVATMPTTTQNANDVRKSVLKVLAQATESLTAEQITGLLGHPRTSGVVNTGWMATVSTALGWLQSMGLAQVQYKRVANGKSRHSYHVVGHWTITPERVQKTQGQEETQPPFPPAA